MREGPRRPLDPAASAENRNVSTDESILERIAAGDSGAVVECIERYGGLVWSLVRSRIRNSADAEDATQEIFVQLWKYAARFDPAKGSETVFIATIARRRLIDRLRVRGREPATEPFDEMSFQPASSGTALPDAADAEIAARALASLDDGQREVVLLSVVQGLSHSEIAAATGKPIGTVKTHVRRGLAKVRALLGPESTTRAAEGGE
jgi:RNA polymerase sigma-70 factor (ECF subfamily)